MEFNTFNNFNIVDNEGCQPIHPISFISKTPEDSHVMRIEEVSIESSDQQSSSEKKYKTLSSEQREDIIKGLKSEGIIGSELTPPQQESWRKFISCLEKKQKNEKNTAKEFKPESEIWKKMLRNVIPTYVPEFDPSDSKEMASMWRKVKRMLGSHGKSEKRGDPNVADDELPEFKERLISIIDNLTSRSFKVLREEVLPLINELRTKNGREGKDDAFSKHYWFDFLAGNSDIRELWEALPRSNAKDKISKLEVALSQSTSASSSSNTFMQSPPSLEAFDSSVDEFGCVRFLSSESLFSGEGYRSVFGGLEEIPHFESSLIQPHLFSFEDEEHFDEDPGTPRFGNSPCHESEEDFARFKKAFIKAQFPEFEDEETQSDSKENYPMSLFEGSLTKVLYDDKVFEDNVHGNKYAFKKQVFGGFTKRNDDEKIELEDYVDHNSYASQKPVFAGLSNGFYL